MGTNVGKHLKRGVRQNPRSGWPHGVGRGEKYKAGGVWSEKESLVMNIIAAFKCLQDEQAFLGAQALRWNITRG